MDEINAMINGDVGVALEACATTGAPETTPEPTSAAPAQPAPLDMPQSRPADNPPLQQPRAERDLITLVDDHFGGNPVAALLELAGRYGIAIAYLDRAWFIRHMRRPPTSDEWKRIAAELDDFCAVIDDDAMTNWNPMPMRCCTRPMSTGITR
ncbi:hypothetical protein BJF79_31215 [Actinomadura sp. CNU-125]|nr:hypothetical protein BJF79_31215 [Actinomadura sp. CNU-125]